MDARAAPPVTTLRGVGPRVAERLARLGIASVQDLLFHLPARYEDRTRTTPLGALQPGQSAVIEGEVRLAEVKFGRRRSLLVRLADGTGAITLRFFHFGAAQQAQFERGARVRCFGEARRGPVTLEMVHPEYSLVQGDEPLEESLTPVYPTTEGVHQETLRKLTTQALEWLDEAPGFDLLPAALQQRFGMPPLTEALRRLHRPPPGNRPDDEDDPHRRRLAFEELLAQHLSLRRLREAGRAHRADPLPRGGTLGQQFRSQLPFELTGAQQRVVDEVSAELADSTPMQRLVQGDVGSGKTVVAALAVLQAVESGAQAAVMAPTELLAEQHYRNFSEWLEPLGVSVTWLSGRLKAAERRDALAAVATGSAQVVVGTHALFQNEVTFSRLVLVVVDEQHRFGVHQRLALREKGASRNHRPHQLIMTATPIPRTLAMTAYADLDVSVIDELPPGRTPVETVVVPESRRDEVVVRVHAACSEGRQVYWVCPLIEESESLECQAAADTAAALTEALPELTVGLIHGRLPPAEKEAVMAAFKAGEVHLLVATTVIEVGVNVPNASLMIIENAERLGLAQLHQLRGRVGRGAVSSSCVLMYGKLTALARERLAVMRETTDGFEVARRDLAIRGPGELLGTRQSGLLQLRVADLQRDADLMSEVGAAAGELMRADPAAVPLLIRRWLGEDAARFADV